MIFTIDERRSDSPFVERIWRAHSEHAGSVSSIAMSHWEMVVTKYNGQTILTVRGPETKATPHHCPADGEWLGIRFKLGTVMPHLPASTLVDRDVNLPNAASRSFWLHGSTWQFPNFENADTFVDWLVRDGLLVRDPVVEAASQGQLKELSIRTARRHFLRTTGLTQSAVRQIERARYATILLQQGVSILDAVYEAGYYDQPHLTRSLKYFIGQTPTQIMDSSRSEQLSFLYKTEPFR
ncbi:MAG TPA: helix-turn-helix domain-containing protein [Anaerolineae bacterium]|nr:helix-turn-helix domain-containing protein [Anaerolineae bacterium]